MRLNPFCNAMIQEPQGIDGINTRSLTESPGNILSTPFQENRGASGLAGHIMPKTANAGNAQETSPVDMEKVEYIVA